MGRKKPEKTSKWRNHAWQEKTRSCSARRRRWAICDQLAPEGPRVDVGPRIYPHAKSLPQYRRQAPSAAWQQLWSREDFVAGGRLTFGRFRAPGWRLEDSEAPSHHRLVSQISSWRDLGGCRRFSKYRTKRQGPHVSAIRYHWVVAN